VSRLADRHLASAIAELLGVARPTLDTGGDAAERFIPEKPAVITGGPALKLQAMAESVAAEATRPGAPAVTCKGAELDCARSFIAAFAARAFRRPLGDDEGAALQQLYQDGRQRHGVHAAGIGLVIQAVVQSPSFLYDVEVVTPGADGTPRLSAHALANRLSFFLRDTIADAALWTAAKEGRLDRPEGLGKEVDRLLAEPQVKANISRMLARFFALGDLGHVEKDKALGFTPALAGSMRVESQQLIDEVLFRPQGKLSELLTSRRARVDEKLAALYGVAYTAGQASPATVTLPPDKRSGILTRAALMSIKSGVDESSAIYRGLMVTRDFLCVEPPPPAAADVEIGETINRELPTERSRAEKRLSLATCAGCHRTFDPLGIAFEHYDAIGRYRTALSTPAGQTPVDASWDVAVGDLTGRLANAVDLSDRLASSRTVKGCMAIQIASYALGRRIEDEQVCAVGELAARFEASGGDLLALVRDVAQWPGLVLRSTGGSR
jgi:hypothetical protein